MFQYFDADSNGTLDLKELGNLNAAIFNMFPRFGYKGNEPPGRKLSLFLSLSQTFSSYLNHSLFRCFNP